VSAGLLAAAGPGGGWTPGLGDPSPIGWITVAAYLVAAGLCVRARQRAHAAGAARLGGFWLALAIALVLLGVNKQLDLQTGLAVLGRRLARAQGWYEARRTVQAVFLLALALGAGAATAWAAIALRRELAAVRLALVGLALLAAFIVARAASFHDVDRILGLRPLGVRVSAALELAGVGVVGVAAARFRPPSRRRRRRRPRSAGPG
jgi:hypothetical protein